VHGLEGDIRHGGEINSYYDDPHNLVGRFDFVLANPPFNVNNVDKDRIRDSVGPGRRFPFGVPKPDNANYLWIQLFYAALNASGRAGFVMANSASDARSVGALELRKQLIEARAVDVMVSVGPNMFYTVTLPCTLWFLDRGKPKNRGQGALPRPRHVYRQIDRAHRDWTEGRWASSRTSCGCTAAKTSTSRTAATRRVRSCVRSSARSRSTPTWRASARWRRRRSKRREWSLNPGRYVGVAPGEDVSDEDFKARSSRR
jgi:type I restriction enzyme M protein